MSDHFQTEIAFFGIESSPAFVRAPEGNGCAERFIRTLKETCCECGALTTSRNCVGHCWRSAGPTTRPGGSSATDSSCQPNSATSSFKLLPSLRRVSQNRRRYYSNVHLSPDAGLRLDLLSASVRGNGSLDPDRISVDRRFLKFLGAPFRR